MQVEEDMSRRLLLKTARQKGSSLVETVCGCVILVCVALFLVDVTAIVICQTQNDSLAKHCARAAAAQDNTKVAGSAQGAVDAVVANFLTENNGSKICQYNSAKLTYDTNAATALVITTVTCNFPVPVPFGPASLQFSSDATEPIIAILPQ
jgi:Flp pilus assembly protein TadG